ncbi:hypothetical protein CORC01_01486, partial [Colletotrichum orchidophilum]
LSGRSQSCTWIHVESLGSDIRRRGVLHVEITSSNDHVPTEGRPSHDVLTCLSSSAGIVGILRRRNAYSLWPRFFSDGRVCREGAGRKIWKQGVTRLKCSVPRLESIDQGQSYILR